MCEVFRTSKYTSFFKTNSGKIRRTSKRRRQETGDYKLEKCVSRQDDWKYYVTK